MRTLAEVDPYLAAAGLCRVGAPTHTRQTSVTAMLRIPTEGGVVRLKALPAMFAHEPQVVQAISRLDPASVPVPIAATQRWWIGQEMPPEADHPNGDPLVALARVQQAASSCLQRLRDAGCVHWSLDALPDAVMAVAGHRELTGAGLSGELHRLSPSLKRLCRDLDAAGIPETVVHGDLQASNVRWTGDRWILFDWTDATIGHPFADLAPPLAQDSVDVARQRAYAFGAAWSEIAPPEAVAIGLATAPAIGAAHQVVNYGKICNGMEAFGADAASPEQMGGLLRFWAAALVEALGMRVARV